MRTILICMRRLSMTCLLVGGWACPPCWCRWAGCWCPGCNGTAQSALDPGPDGSPPCCPGYAGASLTVLCLIVARRRRRWWGCRPQPSVTLFDFPGRKHVLNGRCCCPWPCPRMWTAYAYTDFLQFSGPLQTCAACHVRPGRGGCFLRCAASRGAAWVFIFSLYPYVYLLARTALGERAPQLMEAARLLGAPLHPAHHCRMALPLARPAVAAGVALALMETLADFGVCELLRHPDLFTTGIYKAWLAMDNRVAAAQLATTLLVLVVGVLLWHGAPRAKQQLRFSTGRRAAPVPARMRRSRVALQGGRQRMLAWTVCGTPVLSWGLCCPCGLHAAGRWPPTGRCCPWDRFVRMDASTACAWGQSARCWRWGWPCG